MFPKISTTVSKKLKVQSTRELNQCRTRGNDSIISKTSLHKRSVSYNSNNIWLTQLTAKKKIKLAMKQTNKISKLEYDLFDKIRKDNQEDERNTLKFRQEDKLSCYSSSGLQPPTKWGYRKKYQRITVLGRKKEKEFSMDNCSFDYINRLVLNDMKLYIPSKESFMNNYRKSLVKTLLLESDKGIKHRVRNIA